MEPVKQKEIWYTDLNPIKGSEQSGIRPVVILSGDLLNQYMPIVWIAPLTTKIKGYKGNPVLTPDEKNKLSARSEILVFHLRSVAKERLLRKIGEISNAEFNLAKKTIDDIITL